MNTISVLALIAALANCSAQNVRDSVRTIEVNRARNDATQRSNIRAINQRERARSERYEQKVEANDALWFDCLDLKDKISSEREKESYSHTMLKEKNIIILPAKTFETVKNEIDTMINRSQKWGCN